jgi:hypothetical protein
VHLALHLSTAAAGILLCSFVFFPLRWVKMPLRLVTGQMSLRLVTGQMPLRLVALFQVGRYTTVLHEKIGFRSKPTSSLVLLFFPQLKDHAFWSGPCFLTLAK